MLARVRRFDWLFDRNAPRPADEWDVELAGDSRFAVIPSLGSLVPGWVVIVPRTPVQNLRHLSVGERRNLCTLSRSIRPYLAKFPGTIFEFEHGSAYQGSPMGCGVDQAHLHAVPLQFNLIGEARTASNQNFRWIDPPDRLDPWSSVPEGVEYMVIRSAVDGAVVALVDSPESQWLRKVIAGKLSLTEAWNYRHTPGLPNIRATIDAFRRDVSAH
jgi:diadenosine tetraphosphate (Ap4A) HIT family hydrolase